MKLLEVVGFFSMYYAASAFVIPYLKKSKMYPENNGVKIKIGEKEIVIEQDTAFSILFSVAVICIVT